MELDRVQAHLASADFAGAKVAQDITSTPDMIRILTARSYIPLLECWAELWELSKPLITREISGCYRL